MEGRQRRSFTDDYTRQAVDLVASSGRSIGSVAKELGLRDSVLRRWVERRGAGREPTAATVVGRRANNAVSQGRCLAPWILAERITASAPAVNRRRGEEKAVFRFGGSGPPNGLSSRT
ncbi:MAG TPA: transposase [Bradyrhizobium sp.]|nr:transposase [Bradyrhizobium sp.]